MNSWPKIVTTWPYQFFYLMRRSPIWSNNYRFVIIPAE